MGGKLGVLVRYLRTVRWYIRLTSLTVLVPSLTTATLHWLEWPKFTFRNFSLCRTWLLVWCLECTEVNTLPQFLRIYIGYLLVSQ